MKKSLVVFLSSLVLFSLAGCVLPQQKVSEKPPRTVTVRGTGTVSVQVDVATINFSIITANRSVVEASRQNADAVSNVRKALIDAGYRADTIITGRYSVEQDVSRRNGNSVYGDYRVTNSIHILVRNISDVGAVVDTAIKAGANSLSSIDFSVSDRDSAVREARTNAVKQAYEAANLMVKTAGAELGQVISILEVDSDNYMAYNQQRNFTGYDEASATSVTPGKQKISVTVECTYEIK